MCVKVIVSAGCKPFRASSLRDLLAVIASLLLYVPGNPVTDVQLEPLDIEKTLLVPLLRAVVLTGAAGQCFDSALSCPRGALRSAFKDQVVPCKCPDTPPHPPLSQFPHCSNDARSCAEAPRSAVPFRSAFCRARSRVDRRSRNVTFVAHVVKRSAASPLKTI